MTDLSIRAVAGAKASWPRRAISDWFRAHRRRQIEQRVHDQLAQEIREQLRRDLGL